MSFDTDEPLRHIVIPCDSFVFPWLRIACRPTETEWNVVQVDAYTSADEARAGRSPGCLADDIRPHEMTRSGLMWVEAALAHWDHQRREQRQALHPVVSNIIHGWTS